MDITNIMERMELNHESVTLQTRIYTYALSFQLENWHTIQHCYFKVVLKFSSESGKIRGIKTQKDSKRPTFFEFYLIGLIFGMWIDNHMLR